ncbi:prepilin-type N-terminal cleavage/methylation domain-containing protein [Acinetobacter sp. ANC 4633]|uniref:type IV pilin protein n=1 Tax=Acinetobacter sp. ANC 4633 TaxID=2529845 RepID=UPI00103D67FA|nr:prepilin-type N-terminal cleavage/methylation domain-containing protein [Acinetobacter sp. ANC 4633]TCB25215.1 prepilin-type N-terminal cleavage/methylation domain-containing protein [Acinetobacter sp. ANC 4633]
MQTITSYKKSCGFTLIEMMVAVVIVAILAAIAIPSYQEYARRSRAAQAQQEMQRLAVLLDRCKARNFNYKGFSTASTTVASTTTYPYTITIVDPDASNVALTDNSAVGRNWAIKATTTDPKNYNFLLTSRGLHCKNKTGFNSYGDCGSSGSENW